MPRIKESYITYSVRDFSGWVDVRRKEENMTLDQVGTVLGCTGQYVGAKIKQKKWSLTEFLVLCKRFNASEEEMRRFTRV